MHAPCTAIIHLREPLPPRVRIAIRRMMQAIRGLERIEFEPKEAMLSVQFDREQTGLAEIVRVIEDSGTAVTGVAQRE